MTKQFKLYNDFIEENIIISKITINIQLFVT